MTYTKMVNQNGETITLHFVLMLVSLDLLKKYLFNKSSFSSLVFTHQVLWVQESTTIIRPAVSTKSRGLSQVKVSIFHCITELDRRSASSLVSADVSEGAGRPPGARGRHVELAHRRAGLVHAGEGQGQRACKIRQFSLSCSTSLECRLVPVWFLRFNSMSKVWWSTLATRFSIVAEEAWTTIEIN